MPAERNTKSKGWVFTLNNPTEEEALAIADIYKCNDGVDYLVYGNEVGENGTPHLQGYIHFNKRVRRRALSSLLPRAFIERRKGTAAQAIEYCKKEGDFKEWGISPVAQGQRTDIDDVRAAIKSGTIDNVMDLLENVSSMPAIRFGEKYLSLQPARARSKPNVYWFYGSTGSGKSKAAFAFAEAVTAIGQHWWTSISGNYKWFDGYWGQQLGIFDDFRAESIPYGKLLRLTDRYPVTVEVKGGTTPWKPRTIIFTSPHSITSAFGHLAEDGDGVDQFIRRVDREFNFDGNGDQEWRGTIGNLIPSVVVGGGAVPPVVEEINSEADTEVLTEDDDDVIYVAPPYFQRAKQRMLDLARQ